MTYRRWIKSPAVCKIHLDEAVELLADPLQSDKVLQGQMAQDVWNQHVLPGQVQKLTPADDTQRTLHS